MSGPERRKSPADSKIDEARRDETSETNSTSSGMISGFGRFHTDKNGTRPYARVEWSDILAMVDAPQQDVKKDDAQWLIPSSLDSRIHREQFERGCFHVLWADCDWKEVDKPLSMAHVAQVVASLIGGADYEVYASRSATEERQKCRALIRLDKPLCGSDWVMAQRVLNVRLEEAGIPPDTASEGAGQLCYLPNRGAFYDAISRRGGKHFNPLAPWKDRFAAIRREDQAQADALEAKRYAMRKHLDSLKAADVGQGGPSLIQTFNATFSIDDILIQAGYDQRGQHFRHPQSETGSFSASVKDGRVYSLSSSDPLYTGDHAHDAFSAFTVLFHQGDQRKALIDAGDKWLMIGAESWNAVQRRKFAEERREQHEAPSEDPQEFDYDIDQIPHVEFGVDGFTGSGLTIIASEAGAGKTSMVVPLAATVAHLLNGDPDDPFSLAPVLRRKIVYVTEDAGQVKRLLYGLRRHRSQAPRDEFREWFHIKEARRKSPTEIGADIRKWRDQYRYQAGSDLNNFMVEPLVVLDTSNATIDIENENDNAQVGRAISAIKHALDGRGMIWIIAHLAKGVSRTDVASMSVRGASAWMGDVNATAYLVTDEHVKDKRFLVLGKRRFEPDFTELEVTSETFSSHVQTPWGRKQVTRYMVCDLRGLARKDSMAAQAAKAQTEAYAARIIAFLEHEYEAVRKEGGDWVGMSSSRIEKGVSGKAANVRHCLGALVKDGALRSKTEGQHATAPTFFWLPSQTRVDYAGDKKGTKRDEATENTAQKDEPSVGGNTGLEASSPYSIGTKDEAGVSSDMPLHAFDSLKSGRSWDEAGTKLDESEAEQPDSMADFDSWVGPESMPGYSSDGILRDGSRVVI